MPRPAVSAECRACTHATPGCASEARACHKHAVHCMPPGRTAKAPRGFIAAPLLAALSDGVARAQPARRARRRRASLPPAVLLELLPGLAGAPVRRCGSRSVAASLHRPPHDTAARSLMPGHSGLQCASPPTPIADPHWPCQYSPTPVTVGIHLNSLERTPSSADRSGPLRAKRSVHDLPFRPNRWGAVLPLDRPSSKRSCRGPAAPCAPLATPRVRSTSPPPPGVAFSIASSHIHAGITSGTGAM